MAEKAKEKETKAVTPWRPFMDLTRWEREMDRMMDNFLWEKDETLVAGTGGEGGDSDITMPSRGRL